MSFREHDRHRAAEPDEAPTNATEAAQDGASGDHPSIDAPHDIQPDRFTRRIDCAETSDGLAQPRVARGRRSRLP